ncbi:transcription termination/antitermination NusG family protein, partial [Streptomyces exfoliatus]
MSDPNLNDAAESAETAAADVDAAVSAEVVGDDTEQEIIEGADAVDELDAEDAEAGEPAEQAAVHVEDEAEATAEVAEDEVAEDEAAEEQEPVDPVTALRDELRGLPGEWYVIHTYAGYENRVKTNLEQRAVSLNVEDYIFQAEVPQEEVAQIKNGERKTIRQNKLPGYVLVRMDLT